MKPPLANRNRYLLPGVLAACVLAAGALSQAQAAGPGVHGRVLALSAKGALEGTVPGADIELKSQAGQVVARAKSDAKGYYKVDIPPGAYLYKVQAQGYKDEDVGRGIRLSLTEGYAVYNFSLVKGANDPNRKPPVIPQVPVGKLQGRVLEKTADGKLVGIPRASIHLLTDKPKRELANVLVRPAGKPDDAGKYETALAAGSWRVSVSAAGLETLVDPKPIEIVAGKTESRDFILARKTPEPPTGQGIKGTVTIRQPGASPGDMAKVKLVILSPRGTKVHALNPDAKGGYSWDAAPGSYRVAATAEGYRTARSGLEAVLPKKYTVVDLVLAPIEKPKPPEGQLAFQVTVFERTGDDVVARRPLSGASVLVRKEGQALADAQRLTTDAKGVVTVKLREAGRYQALAQKPNYKPAGAAVSVTVGGKNRAEILLEKSAGTTPTPREARLDLRVAERTPQGADSALEARVEIRQGEKSIARGSSRDDGAYRSPPLPPGKYNVVVSKPGYRKADFELSMAGENVRREVLLTKTGDDGPGPGPGPGEMPARLGTLQVQVLRLAGGERVRPVAPSTVAGAKVVLSQRGKEIGTQQTNRQGMCSFPRLKYGAYEVSVTAEGLPSQRRTVAVDQASVTHRVLLRGGPEGGDTPAPGMATLRIQAVHFAQARQIRPVEAATVILRQEGRLVEKKTTDSAGQCVFTLKQGAYEVAVSHDKFQPKRDTVTVNQPVVTRRIALSPNAPPIIEPKKSPTDKAGERPLGKLSIGKIMVEPPQNLRIEVSVLAQVASGKTRALGNAEVSIASPQGKVVASGKTDAVGRVALDVPRGALQLRARLAAYRPGVQAIQATENGQKFSIVLQPSADIR